MTNTLATLSIGTTAKTRSVRKERKEITLAKLPEGEKSERESMAGRTKSPGYSSIPRPRNTPGQRTKTLRYSPWTTQTDVKGSWPNPCLSGIWNRALTNRKKATSWSYLLESTHLTSIHHITLFDVTLKTLKSILHQLHCINGFCSLLFNVLP